MDHLQPQPCPHFDVFPERNHGLDGHTKAIWQTTDAGRDWRELPKTPKLLMRVYFLDELAALPWAPTNWHTRPRTAARPGNPSPPRRNRTPIPVYGLQQHHVCESKTVLSTASARRRAPEITASPIGWTQGHDRRAGMAAPVDHAGHAGWRQDLEAIHLVDVRPHHARWFLPDGRGLGLIEFTDTFKWPSEVHWSTAHGKKQYRLQRHRPGHHGRVAAALRDRDTWRALR